MAGRAARQIQCQKHHNGQDQKSVNIMEKKNKATGAMTSATSYASNNNNNNYNGFDV